MVAMPFRERVGHCLVCFILCGPLFLSVASGRCSERHCNNESPGALERYNSFVRAVTKSRRSVPLKSGAIYEGTRHRKRSSRVANNLATSYYGPQDRVEPSNGLRSNLASTALQRNVAIEENDDILLQRRRTMQAEQLRRMDRIRQSRRKPWWGQWSTWSACGRTCGSGVQFQKRHCLGSRYIPTYKKGKLICQGPTRKYRICNSGSCPTDTLSFRQLQCTQHAVNEVRGRYYSWKPYGHPVDEIASNEPCQLVCVSDNNEVQLNTVAMDGTDCRQGWNNGRCVEGKCRLIGCDGKINSVKLKNRCGRCDDDETSCVVYDEVVSHSFAAAGEVQVVRIPEGAYDILINERRKTSISIVVKDDSGTVLFNGGGKSSSARGEEGWPANVWIAGAEFRYRRPKLHSVSGGFQYLLTTGPIHSPIVIYMNANHRGSTVIHYEYKIPVLKSSMHSTTTVKPGVDDSILPDSTVVATTSPVSSIRKINIATPPIIQLSPKPQVVLAPELEGMTRYVPGIDEEIVRFPFIDNGDEVYAHEDERFLLQREMQVKQTEEDNTTSSDSLPKYGDNDLVFAKPNTEPSDGQDVFAGGDPSQLAIPVLLGNEEAETIAGVRTVERQIPLGNETDIDYGNYGEGEGDEDIPQDYDIAPGVDVSIPVAIRRRGPYGYRRYLGYRWRTNGFAPCSSTCTSGLQDSYAVCERSRDRITVDDSYCNPRMRPEPVKKSCSNQTCEPRWETTPWSECSLSCGTGVQMRTARCWRMIGPGFDSTMYNEICSDIAGKKPIETKPCEIAKQCGPLWETSDWSACRAPCGRQAVMWRTVRCSAGHDQLCASTPRPHTRKACFGPECVFTWISTDWSPCTGVCGGGRKTRRVVCADHMGRGHPEDRCDIGKKPATSHPCGDENCRPEWIAQDWEECSAECGLGNKTRTVLCSSIVNGEVHQYEDDTPCNGTPKPPTHEPCTLRDCDPVWFNTSWSKCSVTCGNGQRVREVKCYQDSAPATGCDINTKPPDREACNKAACPVPRAAICRNKPSVNCALVVRVSLCSHWYYKKACCSSCQSRKPRGK